jgi:hypothetical protein
MENNSQPVNTPIQPPQQPPVEPVKSGNSKLLLVSLVVLEVVTVLIAVYFAYQFSQLKKQAVVPQPTSSPISTSELPTISPTATGIVSPTPNETASWKTYTEAQYGVSFKYQPSQVVNRNEYNSTYGGKEIVLSTKYNGNGFDWFIEENKNGVSFDTYLKDWTSQQGFTSYTDKTIGGISGKLAEIAGYTGQLDADYAHLEFYMIGNNNNLYRLRLYTNKTTATDSDRQLFNTILGSIEVK